MNEIANICELVDVDVRAVGSGIGYDHRIGSHFMSPGIGYGGSCFPKDVLALERMAHDRGYDAALLRSVETVNRAQVARISRENRTRSAVRSRAGTSAFSGSRLNRTLPTCARRPRSI